MLRETGATEPGEVIATGIDGSDKTNVDNGLTCSAAGREYSLLVGSISNELWSREPEEKGEFSGFLSFSLSSG